MASNTSSPASVTLTRAQARVLHLAAQGLAHKPRAKATPQAIEHVIGQMQMLQIDTIHVVARSPYLVLFSRLGDYPMAWLDELLAAGRLAECWAHEACFVTAQDYPLHRAARPLRESHWAIRRARRTQTRQPDAMQQLLEHVRAHGPVRAADFKRQQSAESGWWDWKPEKDALEAWFALGELMVAERDRFQRVYDLAERVRARHDAGHEPASPALARQHMLTRAVHALGIARLHWVADYFRLPRVMLAELDALCAQGELMRVSVHGWSQPAYVHRAHEDLLARVAAGRVRATRTTVLSPFDPVVWDRRRARELFDFEYTLECYLPAPRRRHGYFVLPILHRGNLVGRLDAKAHRRDGVFDIRAIHLEPDVTVSTRLIDALAQAITRLARWHDTPEIRVQKAQPRTLLAALRAACRQQSQ